MLFKLGLSNTNTFNSLTFVATVKVNIANVIDIKPLLNIFTLSLNLHFDAVWGIIGLVKR